jgi:class 3 adenylate cyclase/tetratricopeptide (TPR) repeat protein
MCGAALSPETTAPRELRKTVTVVFADVSGSTALGERLDPEPLRRTMTRYFDAVRTVLERHGGTVEKFIGDAVMAVFGIPVLHEDDAVRAVRAAAEIRDELSALNAELRRELGLELELRIGVNTGEVMAGDPDRGQSFAAGDAVNVAARLQQAAAPGETIIGGSTYRLVRDAVDAELLTPLEVKGKADAVTAYRLLGIAPEAPGRLRYGTVTMVGRRTELGRLVAAFDQARADRSCQLFTLLGAAGVGKSRLAREFLDSLGDVEVLSGRCLPYGEGITYWPLAEALKEAAGLLETEMHADAQAKLAALVGGSEDADVIGRHAAVLLGLAEGDASTEEGFWAVRKLLESRAQQRPLVLVFDDLHWAEPTFLDLVEHLSDWTRDAPILLLCMARPEFLDARPGWAGGKLNATSVLLEPLAQDECEVLTDELLGAAGLEPPARARIAEAADGNPLFVEELVAMLVEEGVLERRNGSWAATRELAELDIPPTVSALLAARLDRLHAGERDVLEAASVEGKVFHVGAVATLAPEPLRPQVGTQLMSLLRKDLVRPERSSFAGDDAFRFRHLLIRDVAYEALPKERRADLHERFADWLGQRAGERLAEYEEIVGYHLEQAHQYVTELGLPGERADRLARAAFERLVASAGRAGARGDSSAQVALLSRAAALLPPDDPARLELQPSLGLALTTLGDLAQAEAVLNDAIERARLTGAERVEAHASLLRLNLHLQTDPKQDEGDARAEIERLIGVFERLDDFVGVTRATTVLGKLLFWIGRCEQAVEALERANRLADRAGDPAEARANLGWLGWPIALGPMPAEEALARLERIDSAVVSAVGGESAARMVSSVVLAMVGEIDEARSRAATYRAFIRERGLLLTWAGTSMVEGGLELRAGDWDAAERILREGYETLTEIGETGYLSTVVAHLAEAVLNRGDVDEAIELTRVSEEATGRWDLESLTRWRFVRARALARRGEADAAEQLGREAVALAAGTDVLPLRIESLRALADVLVVLDRPHEARPLLEEVIDLCERKGDVILGERARARLDELSRTREASSMQDA